MDKPIPHPNSQNITASLAIDSSGLPLHHSNISPQHSGAYSSIIRIASRLDGSSGTDDTSQQQPTVILEGERDATLIKGYHGRVVVFKVPTVQEAPKDDEIVDATVSS